MVNRTYNYSQQAFSVTFQCVDEYLSTTGNPIGQELTTAQKLAEMYARLSLEIRNNMSSKEAFDNLIIRPKVITNSDKYIKKFE